MTTAEFPTLSSRNVLLQPSKLYFLFTVVLHCRRTGLPKRGGLSKSREFCAFFSLHSSTPKARVSGPWMGYKHSKRLFNQKLLSGASCLSSSSMPWSMLTSTPSNQMTPTPPHRLLRSPVENFKSFFMVRGLNFRALCEICLPSANWKLRESCFCSVELGKDRE